MRARNRLTTAAVRAADRKGLFADGGGLYLQVTHVETKNWIFRFKRGGRARDMGLGPLVDVSLAEAREKARDCRAMLRDGIDPIDERNAIKAKHRLDAARSMTFDECAEAFIKAHRAGWRNEKHKAQWANTLDTYASPVMGKLPVADIDTGLVMKALEPIWTAKPETASRVRQRIERVLDWAKVRGYREGENPAKWRGHLDHLLPKKTKVRQVKHHAALPYTDMPTFLGPVREMDSVSARALEFTILTAARTGEVIGAMWSEIDLDARIWTVPPERTKSGREHRVPLSDRAVEILQALPRQKDNDHVFIGARKGKGLSNMAMLQLLRGMDGTDGLTVHGFRSTFRDWAAERTNLQNYIVEMALAHAIGDEVEAAYRRGDLLDKRRRLMTAWADYCAKPSATGKVVQLRERA